MQKKEETHPMVERAIKRALAFGAADTEAFRAYVEGFDDGYTAATEKAVRAIKGQKP